MPLRIECQPPPNTDFNMPFTPRMSVSSQATI
jgi:hypothetical protein